MGISRKKVILESIFYSNYFYGLAAVILSVEAILQQRFPVSDPGFLLWVMCSTTLFYTYPYIRKIKGTTANRRTDWYSRNHRLMVGSQVLLTLICAGLLCYFILTQYPHLLTLDWKQWLLLLIFPMVGCLYYGLPRKLTLFSLRRIGLLKPFFIGFCWAGMVTIYPVLYHNIVRGENYIFTLIAVLLFLKNMMFIALLCIMFDFKDYAVDYFGSVKTFVVSWGLRKTIFYILIPLILIGLATFITYSIWQHFHFMKVLLNVIPFLLLLYAALSFYKRRPLLYYLVVIDGLIIVKGLCGIIAMSYF